MQGRSTSTLHRKSVWVSMLSGLLWVGMGCGGMDAEENPQPLAPESTEQASVALALPRCSAVCGPTASCDTLCENVPGEPMNCGDFGVCAGGDIDGDGVPYPQDNCPRVYNPNQSDCDRDGRGDACETDPGVYVFKAPTMMLCHFDKDWHISGVDVEIYTSDVYQDVSCLHLPDRYSHREVSSVHCGFNSESTCQNRVIERVQELAAQGYYPTTTVPDQDMCPQPRL